MQQSDLANLDELRAFLLLAETGSFAAAARRLGRDATAVSRRVQALEARLGLRLAERTTRRVALTDAGHAYLARIRAPLEALAAAESDMLSLAGGAPQGRLHLALPGSFGRLWLAPLIIGFAQAHPRVTIEAHYTNRLVDLVAEGYDLAVRLAVLPDSRLVARKVADRRRLLCAAPGYLARHAPLRHPQDLADHDALFFTGRDNWDRWMFVAPAGGRITVAPRTRLASDDADVLVEAAIAGLGLFYTTDWHAGAALADGRLVLVLPEWTLPDTGAIFVVTPSAGLMPPKTRAFSDWVAAGLTPPPWRARPPS